MEVIMTKIMLVEDDKSLREIYGVRLIAEGYQIISAGDGEEALAMAIKEKPNLIISDVMMPKISGFDMLDILRSTPETKDMKVIVMTALSSEDQRARGESLGANRYLVKSQVGIEDVVRAVHEVLADMPASQPKTSVFGSPAPSETITTTPAVETTTPSGPTTPITPVTPSVSPPTVSPDTPQAQPGPIQTTSIAPSQTQTASNPSPAAQTVIETPSPSVIQNNSQTFMTNPTTPEIRLPQPTAPFSSAAPASLGENIASLQSAKPDISQLINQELETTPVTEPSSQAAPTPAPVEPPVTTTPQPPTAGPDQTNIPQA